MKRLLISMWICSACNALAQIQVLVPGGLANVEGNSSSMTPFGLGGSRMQQVFSASEFEFLGGATGRIENIWFRLDANAGTNMLANYPTLRIALSTTARSPDGLDSVFQDNSGTDFTIVYLASRILLADYTPGIEPQPFSVGFSLSTPFDYVPSRGNLLLDIRAVSGMFNPVPLDAQSVAGDSMSRVFAGSDAATTGTADTLGLVTRFDVVPVPEPALFSFITGLVAILCVFRFLRIRARLKEDLAWR